MLLINNLSDEDILERVNKYHGKKTKRNVNNRINTLYFLDNLEKSIVVEKH